MRIEVSVKLPFSGWAFGLVLAGPLAVKASSPALRAAVEAAIGRCVLPEGSDGALPPAGRKESVRALLRSGGFKPAGRNKPASEYLVQAAREGRFPLINGLVDVNNLLSLETGYPISLLDAQAFLQGEGQGERGVALIRLGAPGESYVFNQSGQAIDVEGLVSLCSGDGRPLGNAVKDSMAAKLAPDTRCVLGCVYAPSGEGLEAACRRFLDLLTAEGRAEGLNPRGAMGCLESGKSEHLALEI